MAIDVNDYLEVIQEHFSLKTFLRIFGSFKRFMEKSSGKWVYLNAWRGATGVSVSKL